MCEVEFLGGVVLEEGASDYFYVGQVSTASLPDRLISRISITLLIVKEQDQNG